MSRREPLPKEFGVNATREDDDHHDREVAEAGPEDQQPGRARLGTDAEHQREQPQRDERAQQRFLQDEGCTHVTGAVRFWSGRRLVRHAGAQTFSTSGRPRRPVGMKIRTTIRIEKAATSLYSDEK